MADKRIYELDATNTAQSGDFFVIDSEGDGTRKITKSNLLGGIEEDVQALETKVGTVALTTTAQDCSGAINELKDTTDDTTNMMSDAYDNTATYVVGDIVIYDGALYKCNTDISTAEDFDSTKWDATTIDAELSKVGTGAIDTGDTDLTSAVNTLNSSLTQFVTKNITWNSNPAGYTNGNYYIQFYDTGISTTDYNIESVWVQNSKYKMPCYVCLENNTQANYNLRLSYLRSDISATDLAGAITTIIVAYKRK